MNDYQRPLLLVSVRCRHEVEAVIAGGADILDIKEPHRGSLGAADMETINEIVEAVAGRIAVSVALGELREHSPAALRYLLQRLAGSVCYVKIGLAGEKQHAWRNALLAVREWCPAGTELVPAAYADHSVMMAPTPREVAEFAIEHGFRRVLVDTGKKDGRGLTHSDFSQELEALHHDLRGKFPWVAAGSLRESDLPTILRYTPWCVAVRGAVCRDNLREGVVEETRVRNFAQRLQSRSPE